MIEADVRWPGLLPRLRCREDLTRRQAQSAISDDPASSFRFRTIGPPAQGQCQQPRFHLDKASLCHPILQPQGRSWILVLRYALHICLGPHLQGMVSTALSASWRSSAIFPAKPTGGQRPIVGLGVVVNFDHLTPPSWSKNTKDVTHIPRPPVCIDAPRHHPTVNEVKVVGRECRRAVEIIDLELKIQGCVLWYWVRIYVDSNNLGNSPVSLREIS